MQSLGGIVPLNVHTEFGSCVGRSGMELQRNRAGRVDARIQVRRAPRVVDVLVFAPSCVTLDGDLRAGSARTAGAPRSVPADALRSDRCRRAHAASAGLSRLLRQVGLRRRRGRQTPTDRSARQHVEARHRRGERPHAEQRARRQPGRDVVRRALRTNGLSPLFATSTPPPAEKMPHFISSRREIWPCDQAFRISCRLRRAFSAALSRLCETFLGNQCDSPPPLYWLKR